MSQRSNKRSSPPAPFREALELAEGWTYPDEAWALHEAARNLGKPDATVVEIGSWKGRSTIALALAIRDRGAGRIYAIDPHTGSRDYVEEHGPVDTYATFLGNLKSAGVSEYVVPIRERSHQARSQFSPESVDMLFIDGSHDYDDVKQDIVDWIPTLRPDATVAFNDPFKPGVYRALRELVFFPRSPFRSQRQVNNTMFTKYRPDVPWRPSDFLEMTRVRLIMALHFRLTALVRYLPTGLVGMGRSIYQRLLG